MAHRLLEVAAKRRVPAIKVNEVIEAEWDAQVESVERSMQDSWLDRWFVPLRRSVADYQVRRLRACNQAVELALTPRADRIGDASSEASTFEVWVQSLDGRVGGYIDHLVDTPNGVVLRDYKTGYVLTKTGVAGMHEVKESYQEQMRLYAALYHSTFGTWPVALEIVPLQGESIPVTFDPQECAALLAEAIGALNEVNRLIAGVLGSSPADPAPLATPAPSICAHCPYRPVCSAYWDTRRSTVGESWPNDCRGSLLDIRTLGNGKRMLSLDRAEGPAVIRSLGMSPDRHPALSGCSIGDTIAAFNLRAAKSSGVFEESPMTVVYRMNN